MTSLGGILRGIAGLHIPVNNDKHISLCIWLSKYFIESEYDYEEGDYNYIYTDGIYDDYYEEEVYGKTDHKT